MSRYQILAFPENCTGCMRCMLSCSRQYFKIFNPAISRICVQLSGIDCAITFTDECNHCGICADGCFFGALSKQVEEKTK